MEDVDEQGAIDSKYIILDKKGHGYSSNVYLVKDTTNQKLYAAKVLKKPSELFKNEINILNALKEMKSPYLVNMIGAGEGIIKRKNKENKRQYLILDYASKGEIMNYIFFPKVGLGEKLSKLIFYKILEGLQSVHNAGICHRDIKVQNILLDENFTPKICDFGFATINKERLTEKKRISKLFCSRNFRR